MLPQQLRRSGALRSWLGAAVLPILALGCDGPKQAPSRPDPPATPVGAARALPMDTEPGPSAPSTPTLEDAIFALAEAWNGAHRHDHVGRFDGLYGEKVVFYGVQLSRRLAVDKKRALLAASPGFQQRIGGLRVIEKGGRAHASFVKRVTMGGQESNYPSYLEFAREDGRWVIVTEGDDVTDQHLTRHTGTSVGDYDGDGAKETARLIVPETDEEGMDCVGACDCTIVFSDPGLPRIPIENCIGGVPTNEGDLDGDGADEVGLLPWWFTSCWRSYQVYSIRQGRPETFVFVLTHCDQWNTAYPIEKDPAHPGYVIIRESRMEDGSVRVRSVKASDLAAGRKPGGSASSPP